MNDKIKPTHLERAAYVYVRQSTAAQVQYNKESTDRQYKLAERALRLGWSEPQIVMRFWIIAFVLAMVGLSTLKLR